MDIKERVKIAILMKYYGSLLTPKKQNIIKLYVDENLSLQEVADECGITRQAVKDSLAKAVENLNFYENNLHFVARDDRIKDIIKNLDDESINNSTKDKLLSIIEEV